VVHEVMIRFYPDRSTYVRHGVSGRFGPISCRSDWPFDGPSRSTFHVDSLSRTYWLVTVSGFQGSSAAEKPISSCGFVRRHCAVRFGRRVNTLLIHSVPVNTFFQESRSLFRPSSLETKTPPGLLPRGMSSGGGP